jgi:phosphate transport system substrate-binding protein
MDSRRNTAVDACRHAETDAFHQHLAHGEGGGWPYLPGRRRPPGGGHGIRQSGVTMTTHKGMKRMKAWKLAMAGMMAVLAMAGVPGARAESAIEVDADLPVYERVEGVSGNLNSIGSDTLNNLMALWAEGFRAIYPNINIQIEGKGSSTAPPALIEGTAQLGPMSREMKSSEIDAFEKQFGYVPTEVKVAVDALAVFVHKDNPLAGMTLKQVDSVFSSTFKSGGEAIDTWDQLGLGGGFQGRAISLYGRNSASGTYGFFKENALSKGDYRATVKEQPGSSSVVTGIANDLFAMGYSGIGYKTAGVRALPLGEVDGEFFEASPENALAGEYPLARFLMVYVNKAPNQPMDVLTYEFLRFVLSKQGQEIVAKDGYFPMPAEMAAEVLAGLK